MSDTRAAKRALRARIRAARRARAASTDEVSRAAAADALATAALALVDQAPRRPAGARRVTAYESWETEPPTEALRERLREAGVEILLPITNPDLTLDWRVDGTDDPLGAEALATADLVLTPGLAVDRRGLRLGQGGGCYDGALRHVRSGVLVVTVLWDDEVVDEVPAEPHDRAVDGVLTPTRGVVLLG